MTVEVLRRAKKVIRDAERGASAVILALSMVVMMGSAALGMDIASYAYVKQLVRNSVDSAAQIGASQLGSGTDSTAVAAAITTAFSKAYSGNFTGWGNYPKTLTVVTATDPRTQNVLKISFLCVVGNPTLPADPTVAAQALSVCGVSSYDASAVKCSTSACAVPCPTSAACNSVSVSANVTVNFVFAPAININQADTGAVTTLSCACGDGVSSNPMNVVVMADRTPSMFSETGAKVWNSTLGKYDGDRDLTALKSGIQSMLQVMSPAQQYVACGAIHKSLPKVTSGNLATPPTSSDNLFTYTTTTSDQYSNPVTGFTSTICTASGYYWKASTSTCYKTATFSSQTTSISISNSTICTAAGYTWSSNSCYKAWPYTSTNKVTTITTVTSAVCTAAGYYWNSNSCYKTATYTTQITTITTAICTAAGYFWNSADSSCYQTKTPTTTSTRNDVFTGTWVPVAFSNNYLNAAGTGLNTTTNLYQSVSNLTYSNATTSSNGSSYSSYKQADGLYGNTHLAAAMKGAAQYLLNKDPSNPNNIAALDAVSKRPDTFGTPKNVIIFETDGSPSEVFTNATSTTDDVLKLDNHDDIGNKDGEQACKNFDQVAQYAKDAGILIITIGFGDAASSSNYCDYTNRTKTASALAAAASPVNGVAAAADKTCADENTDQDNYYCAANGSDLAKVFKAALGSLGGGTRFLAIPGIGN